MATDTIEADAETGLNIIPGIEFYPLKNTYSLPARKTSRKLNPAYVDRVLTIDPQAVDVVFAEQTRIYAVDAAFRNYRVPVRSVNLPLAQTHLGHTRLQRNFQLEQR